jgi:hypothetical protein
MLGLAAAGLLAAMPLVGAAPASRPNLLFIM